MDPLIAYIEKELKKGFSEELIRQKLTTAGYSPEEMTSAFQEHEVQQHYRKFIDKIVEQETKHKWLFAVLSIFAIIFITALLLIGFLSIDWHAVFTAAFPQEEEKIEPQTEEECQMFTHRDKERCLLKVAALYDDTSFCTNLTSKVMKYECKTEVWKKNYCNFLILTDQGTVGC